MHYRLSLVELARFKASFQRKKHSVGISVRPIVKIAMLISEKKEWNPVKLDERCYIIISIQSYRASSGQFLGSVFFRTQLNFSRFQSVFPDPFF